MSSTGSFRKKKGFTIAGNTLVHDKTISLKSKGLYLLIMSYITYERIDLTKSFLQGKCSEGEKAFGSAWNELKIKGYLKIYMKQSKTGWQPEYDLLEEPITGPYCFYLSANGQITSTNETKYLKKDSGESSEKSTYPLQNGRYANDTYADGSSAKCKYANGGNNIRLLNNTSNNTFNNIQSINPSLNSHHVKEEENMEALLTEVKSELKENEGIPYEYKSNIEKMKAAIRILTYWYELTDKHFHSKFEKSVFDLLVDCLIEMACDSEISIYKSSHISYKEVIEKINDCIKADCDLSHFVAETTDDFLKASAERKITDKRKYMKSVIWNSLCTYKVKFELFCRKDLKEV